ncbi:Sulfolipid-1 exporter Sap [Mycobacterium simulans]|uniref:Sulfolipid-1 exporter Sap n=1 Tax=Mycobacterium simulans TaxID=627089 RepID=A0A7Z7IJZ6_9MYCO|nr:GAP family protein [Mycobacterium simulans]SOJ54939.1 Sulfolipid-1 exporter Sap [Mycobacterium simulans]SON63807.1 Sulfolipid-1 exporter Sap [Mycobacterium simulans]
MRRNLVASFVMWTYVIALGFGVLIDPARIGIAAVLTSRRQAIRSLVAFWLGGIAAGIGIGIAVLILLHDIALGAIQTATSTIDDLRSAVVILAGGGLHVTIGVIALVCLATMLARERARVATPVPVAVGGGGSLDVMEQPGKTTLVSRLSSHTQNMLERGRAWPAFVAGLGTSVPPIEGPMALTVIMASGAGTHTQFGAFILFVLLVLVFVEIPLVCYLAAPQKTQTVMLSMNTWLRTHRRRVIEFILAFTAAVFLFKGFGSL